MNYYDKLDNADRAWSVCEVARFLGYSTKYVYRLIRENRIGGWFKVKRTIKFCPAKFKIWLETACLDGRHDRNKHDRNKADGPAGGTKGRPRSEDGENDDRVA